MNGITVFFMALVLFQSTAQAPAPAQSVLPKKVESAVVPVAPAAATTVAATEKSTVLSKIHRIYVVSFGTTESAQAMEAMVIASITESKRLVVTEDKSKADAILRGFAAEKTSQELHAYGSGTSVATAAGGHSGSISGSGGNISGSSSGGFGAASSAINDSSVNTETIDSAKASVRLVNADGDVIWTSTQESKGAKYKGASADVAEKIVKQLLRDIEKAEKTSAKPDAAN